MFVIKDKQMEAFRQIEVEKFVQKSVLFLRDNFKEWCSERPLDEITDFIHNIIALGNKYHINKQKNLQKLMFLRIEYGFLIPLEDNHKRIFEKVIESETSRVATFFKNLHEEKNSTNKEQDDGLDWLN